VHLQAAGLDGAMLDAVDVGKLEGHVGGASLGHL
jgi:hypothetical protein